MFNWKHFKIKLSFVSVLILLLGFITYFHFPFDIDLFIFDKIFMGSVIDFKILTMTREIQTLIAMFLSVSIMLLWSNLGWKKGLFISISLMFTLAMMTIIFFVTDQYLIPVFYWILSIIVASLLSFPLILKLQQSDQETLEQALGMYVSSTVKDDILRRPQKLSLHGKKQKIVVMFLDIRGFTKFSENIEPKEVMKMLNDILGVITKVVQEYDGTVDKYLGDGAMVTWGAPDNDDNMASKACLAAREIQKRLKENTENISVGIGINYGMAIVGNIGSEIHLDYTAIGDTVNTASRVENITREFDHNTLLTNDVKIKVEKEEMDIEDLKFRKVKAMKLRGKKDKVKLWTIRLVAK